MQIVLMCRDENGSVAFRGEMIEGRAFPSRTYEIANYRVTLEGYSDEILHHDAEVLLSNPFYRMPTPAEQAAMAEAERAAVSVQEAAPASKKPKAEANGG